jgi:hypothetical protein
MEPGSHGEGGSRGVSGGALRAEDAASSGGRAP